MLKLKQFLSGNLLACISLTSFLFAIGFVLIRKRESLQLDQAVVNYWWLMLTQSDDLRFGLLSIIALINFLILFKIARNRVKKPTFAVVMVLAINVMSPFVCGYDFFLTYGASVSHVSTTNFNGSTYQLARLDYLTDSGIGWINYRVYKCDNVGMICALNDGSFKINEQLYDAHFVTEEESKQLFVQAGVQKHLIDSVEPKQN